MWHLKHNVGSNPICSTKVWSFFQMTQSALVAPGTKGVKKPRLPNYNDRMSERRRYGSAKAIGEIHTGVRVPLRSQNYSKVHGVVQVIPKYKE